MPLLLHAAAAGYTAGPGWETPVCLFICLMLKKGNRRAGFCLNFCEVSMNNLSMWSLEDTSLASYQGSQKEKLPDFPEA